MSNDKSAGSRKKSAAERSATETKDVAVERKGGERSSAEIVCFRASGTDPRHQRYCAAYSGRGTLAPVDETKRSVNGTFERIFSDPDPKNAVVWLFLTLFHLLPRDLSAFWFGTRRRRLLHPRPTPPASLGP